MTRARHEAWPPARRRRRILLGVLRSLLGPTILLALYYLLPLERPMGIGATITLIAALLVFMGVVGWQILRIRHSDYPRLRALEALATSIPLFLLIFSASYFILADEDSCSFTEPLTRTDALYFALTVFSTVGFGDITPRTGAARVVTMTQMVGDIIAIGLIARLFLGAVTAGLRRRSTEAGEPGGGRDVGG